MDATKTTSKSYVHRAIQIGLMSSLYLLIVLTVLEHDYQRLTFLREKKRGQEEICCIFSQFCPALLLRKGMPRQVRVEYPGAIYHVMARGNHREKIVRDDDGFLKLHIFEKVLEGDGEFDFGEGECFIEAGYDFAFEGFSVPTVEGEGGGFGLGEDVGLEGGDGEVVAIFLGLVGAAGGRA